MAANFRFKPTIARAGEALAVMLQEMADRLDELSARLDASDRGHAELGSRVRRLTEQPRVHGEADATKLERIIEQLLQGQRDHDNRLTLLSQQRTAERLTTGDYMVHHDIAKRYHDLIGQEFVGVAASMGNLDPEQEALMRSFLAIFLFMPEQFSRGPDATYRGLHEAIDRILQGGPRRMIPWGSFARVWEAAREIRDAAARSGHRHEWRFDYEQGAPVDQSWQDVYHGCGPEDPVVYVVAPAYVVDGERIYAKQLVFTEPSRPPQRDAAPHDGPRAAPAPSGAGAQRARSDEPAPGTESTPPPGPPPGTAPAGGDSPPAAPSDHFRYSGGGTEANQ